MLFIQEINLIWSKNQRGAGYAEIRRQFPLAYSLESSLPLANVVVHRLGFYQRGEGFVDSFQEIAHMQKYRLQFYHSIEDVNLVNLAICPCLDGFEVSFFYDERRSGMPFRRGHNKDYNNSQSPLYRRDCLNETAFILEQNQYGRILWNERKRDYDTGEWYYQFHIYNIMCLPDEIPKTNIFVANEPDFVYKQMAVL